MRRKLIVSEVAKLLEISTHTIRYYCKEGLISSEYDSESGYRLFDMADVIKLSNIIIFREAGIPIKKIKELVKEFSTSSYKQQLKLSLLQIEQKQKKLEMQKKIINSSLKFLEEKNNSFEIKYVEKKFLKWVSNKPYDEERSPVEMFEILKKEQIKGIMYKDIVYELRENDMSIAFEFNSPTKYFIESGFYFEHIFTYKTYDELTQAIIKLLDEAKKRNIKLEKEIYLSMKPHAMLAISDGFKVTLFSKIIV